MAKKVPPSTPPLAPRPLRAIRQDLRRAESELALAELQYTTRLLKTFQEASGPVLDEDARAGWVMVSSGGAVTLEKDLPELRDLSLSRKEAYRAWRLNPHARGILRTFQKFVIGRGFEVDPAESRRGVWNDERTALVIQDEPPPSAAPAALGSLPRTPATRGKPLTTMVWEEWARRATFNMKDKEIVRRTFRDGECFIRRFVEDGWITLRFLEPAHVTSTSTTGQAQVQRNGLTTTRPTVIREGIEVLAEDVETVVAYRVTTGGREASVPADEVIHIKCLADTNDPRGFPLLEATLKKLKAYEMWEEYRIILNQVQTAVALVRKIEAGSSTQAQTLISGRASAREHPEGREPQTTSGRRETMFRPGTMLTAGPGVSYQFTSPQVNARDAGEDGRRILLGVAAGLGLPEMLVTADWSNSNYASSVEGRGPLVREIEDWQDFFTPYFQQIWEWVMRAAVDAKALPGDTDLQVAINWPPIIHKDAGQETERHLILASSGVLSKKTWAGREGLVWEDEAENLAQEDGSLGTGVPPLVLPGQESRQRALLSLGRLSQAAQAHPDPAYRHLLEQFVDAAGQYLAEYSPDQARDPAGSPSGGQWTAGGGGSGGGGREGAIPGTMRTFPVAVATARGGGEVEFETLFHGSTHKNLESLRVSQSQRTAFGAIPAISLSDQAALSQSMTRGELGQNPEGEIYVAQGPFRLLDLTTSEGQVLYKKIGRDPKKVMAAGYDGVAFQNVENIRISAFYDDIDPKSVSQALEIQIFRDIKTLSKLPRGLKEYSPDQLRDDSGRWAETGAEDGGEEDWEDPPAPKGKPGGQAGGYSATGQTNTVIGDLGERLAQKLGLKSLLPKGQRQNPLDATYKGYGVEIKTMTTRAAEYKVKMKAAEADEKLAYAKHLKLKPATMIVVMDPGRKTAWGYLREGIGNYRLTLGQASSTQGWQFLGRVTV